MATFREATQARSAIKLKLSNYNWYNWSLVVSSSDGYSILVNVKKIDNFVRKTIPPVINGVELKIEEG